MKPKETGPKKFGTFGGVYVPTILTILGVIMYLRLGWIVGNAGLVSALAILAIAESITILTAFSLAAISTNMEIKGGGAYYLISRSLGIEIGGSIGIPLFISQTFGIGFYVVGFSETFCSLVPGSNMQIVGVSVLVILTILALISSSLAIKTQYIVLVIILISLVSLLLGRSVDPEQIITTSKYTGNYSFWTVFAVFFPAVTGMEAGLSMSGDLENPKKNIPLGTITAVFTGLLVYGGLIVWFSMISERSELISDRGIVIQLAKWPPLIIAGILAATLSSALASIMAAPRTLQALAKDKILPQFIKGENDSLIIATFVSFLIALFVVFMGELNLIAPILTMFFLITYGSINLIAWLENIIGLPSYRPAFKVHWIFSLLGAVGAIWVMLVINLWACIIGFILVLCIFIYLKTKNYKNNLGDARRGFWHAMVQYSLGKLEQTRDHPKNWRPNILIFTKIGRSGTHLLSIANALSEGHGMIAMIHIVDIDDKEARSEFQNEREKLTTFMKNNKIEAFMDMAMGEDNFMAQLITTQVHGIGNYRPNTVLMEWAESKKSWFLSRNSEMSRQMKLLKFYKEMGKSIILLNMNVNYIFGNFNKIHIWWDPTQENGSFMLLLAHLISTNVQWGNSSIYLKSVVMSEKCDETRKILISLIHNARIKARVDVYTPEIEISRKEQFEKTDNDQKLEIKVRKPDWFRQVFSRNHGESKIEPVGKKPVGKNIKDIWSKIRKSQKSLSVKSIPQQPETSESIEKEHDESDISTSAGHSEIDLAENIAKPVEQAEDVEELISKQVDEEDREQIENVIDNIIIQNSKEADIVILGFNVPAGGKEQAYVIRMDNLLQKLPSTLLVNSGFDVDLYS